MLGGPCFPCCVEPVYVGFRGFAGACELDSWNLAGGENSVGVQIRSPTESWQTVSSVVMGLFKFGQGNPLGLVSFRGDSEVVQLRVQLSFNNSLSFPNGRYEVIYEKPRADYLGSLITDGRVIFRGDEAISAQKLIPFAAPADMSLADVGDTGLCLEPHSFATDDRRYTLTVSSPGSSYVEQDERPCVVACPDAWDMIYMWPENIDGEVASLSFQGNVFKHCYSSTVVPGSGKRTVFMQFLGNPAFLVFTLASVGELRLVRRSQTQQGLQCWCDEVGDILPYAHYPLQNCYTPFGVVAGTIGPEPGSRSVSRNAWAVFAENGVLESGRIHAWPAYHSVVREWGPMSFTIEQSVDEVGPECNFQGFP